MRTVATAAFSPGRRRPSTGWRDGWDARYRHARDRLSIRPSPSVDRGCWGRSGCRAPASITIMDGPFVSLMPLGFAGRYLLLHVDHSVVARSTQPLMDLARKKRETSPFATMDIDAWSSGIWTAAAIFFRF